MTKYKIARLTKQPQTLQEAVPVIKPAFKTAQSPEPIHKQSSILPEVKEDDVQQDLKLSNFYITGSKDNYAQI